MLRLRLFGPGVAQTAFRDGSVFQEPGLCSPHVHTGRCVHVYGGAYTRIRMYMYMYNEYIYIYLFIPHTRIYIYIHILYTHTYEYTYIYTHTVVAFGLLSPLVDRPCSKNDGSHEDGVFTCLGYRDLQELPLRMRLVVCVKLCSGANLRTALSLFLDRPCSKRANNREDGGFTCLRWTISNASSADGISF